MWEKRGWRHRSTSKRRKLVSALSSGQDSFRLQSTSRARQIYNFFADFWHSTPHPVAQMVMVVASSAVVATVNDSRVLDAGLRLDSLAGRALQTILAFLIVFRTNQSYNRWWEGRILWGKMHWSCLELTQQAATWIEDAQLARRIMNFSIGYAYTVKQILRRERLFAEDLEGIIDADEVERMNDLSMPVMPYYCTDVIRQCIKKGLTENPQKFGVQAVARGIDIPVSQLSMQFADMARVRNTPQPDCFRVMLHMFTLLYLLLLPLVSYDTLGYFVIPEVLLTSYLMLGLQIAADYLEDPFGRDQTDLELDLYVENIATQCRESFYLGDKSSADLTLDGGGTKRHKPRRPSGTGGGGGKPPVVAVGAAGSGAFGSGGGRGVFYSAGAGAGGGGGAGDNQIAGDGGGTALGWHSAPALDAHRDSTSALVTPNSAGVANGGPPLAGRGSYEEGGGDGGMDGACAGAGSGDGGAGAGGSAVSPLPRRQEQTPMGSPMSGLPATSGEQQPDAATSPVRKPLQQQTPIGTPMRGLPPAGEQTAASATTPLRQPMQQQTPMGTPMRGLPPSAAEKPVSTVTPLRKPMQQQTPIGTPMRGLPPPGVEKPASAVTPLRKPMQQQTPIGSPMVGLPASVEQMPVTATSTLMQQQAQDARPPLPVPRPRLEQQQQSGGAVSGHPAFARASALPAPALLQQTPTRGLVSKTQASGRSNGDGGEGESSSHPATSRTPVVGAANVRHSFPRTASIGGGGGGGGSGSGNGSGGGGGGGVGNRKNSSQFAILAESALASEEEDEPDSSVHNPAETPVGASMRTMAAPVGPRRDFRRGRSPEHSSYGTAGVSAAPPPPRPASFSSSVTGALARKLSKKTHRVHEDAAPKRRSKPRPGRGKAPHVEASGAEGAAETPLGLGPALSNPLSETAPDAV